MSSFRSCSRSSRGSTSILEVARWVALAVALSLIPGSAAAARIDQPGDGAEDAAPLPPAEHPSRTRKGQLRVASFNIAWLSSVPGKGFVPRSEKDFGQLVRVLRGTHAHILGLQEIGDVGALRMLAEEMNRLAQGDATYDYRDAEGTEIYWPGTRIPDQQVGVIYDRQRVEVVEARPLDDPDDAFIRRPVWLRVKVRGTDLDMDVVVVHLKSGVFSGWAGEIREREVKALLDWVERRKEEGEEDILLIGDFNAPRDHDTLAALDGLADSGEMVAVEDHLEGPAIGTHIPWGSGLDRAFMTRALWEKAGIEEGAHIYRFEEFVPRSEEKEFCIRTRYRVKTPSRRCECGDDVEPWQEIEEGEDGERPDVPLEEALPPFCGGEPERWVKVANYIRISDHRPLLWDLEVPRPRERRSRNRRRRYRSRRR